MQGIDIHTWLVFLFVIVVSVCVLVIKMTSANVNKVIDVFIVDDSGSANSSFYPNENLTFTTKAKGRVVWDFGDGVQVKGNRVAHSFFDDGKKVVTVIVNGVFKTDTVIINKTIVVEPSPTDLQPIFGPLTVNARKLAVFKYNGKSKVTSFEWTIENDNTYPTQTSDKAYYNFQSAGSFTIRLELNHDPIKVFHKDVTVVEAHERLPKASGHHQQKNAGYAPVVNHPVPGLDTAQTHHEQSFVVPNKPTVERAIKTCDDCDRIFQSMFEDVARGRSFQDFDDYFCKGVNPTVIADDQSTTIKNVCDMLSTGKKKLKKVTVSKDFQQCIKTINIQYKKKFLSF